ncbi:hypothetical protein [Rhizobium binxianense]|uniref:hypothetical protein n=1 Tax=Rhizobium binxianense TaxID=3024242 RepID=UPI00234E94D6|nr:hypothetical protein [Rhizobium sp. BC56]MDC7742835.1 hypothetical protein [Rhizobium sp. BC56]
MRDEDIIAQQIVRIERAVDRIEAKLDRVLAQGERLEDVMEPAPNVTDDDFAPYNLIDTGAAAQRAKVSKSTIRKWVNDDGIGFKRGGRLRVSIPRLRRHTGDDAL